MDEGFPSKLADLFNCSCRLAALAIVQIGESFGELGEFGFRGAFGTAKGVVVRATGVSLLPLRLVFSLTGKLERDWCMTEFFTDPNGCNAIGAVLNKLGGNGGEACSFVS